MLELDEAHAVPFVRAVAPRYSLILNVMRDQLDRFGEIDATARLLKTLAVATTETVVLNREDQRVAAIKDDLSGQTVRYFGLADDLLATFPGDDNLHGGARPLNNLTGDVILTSFDGDQAVFQMGRHTVTTPLKLTGIYNVYNAAAALALTEAIMGDQLDQPALIAALSAVTPAFGRGETLMVAGQPTELVLVKNPSGFRLGLESFDPAGYATMIAINDNYADGRDMSWLWDVDFASLRAAGVAKVAGIRAYDMALRLQYDEVPIAHVEPDLKKALRRFLADHPDQPIRIYCTYTAMLALRRAIGKLTTVEAIG